MRGGEFLDKLTWIDEELIEEADRAGNAQVQRKCKKGAWPGSRRKLAVWAGTIAACLCIALAGGLAIRHFPEGEHPVQKWSASMPAEDYFKYNETPGEEQETSSSIADSTAPYAYTRYFSGERGELETEQVIPPMETRPVFFCQANYNEDGNLYSISFSWHRQGSMEEYSNLEITAGYGEVEKPEDCVSVAVDEKGNIVEPSVTVTERDGILITARGNRKGETKTLTFENEAGWYQIEGSWNDAYEDMAELLDWLWEHPIDFARFPMEAGDAYTYVEREDFPEAFAGYIPDFTIWGYEATSESLTLKNGEPVSFEGCYEDEGRPSVWWVLESEPGFYDLEDNLGDLGELTQEAVTEALHGEQHITFTWDGFCVRIYMGSTGTPELIWGIVESVR